jgi:hypothetical protein
MKILVCQYSCKHSNHRSHAITFTIIYIFNSGALAGAGSSGYLGTLTDAKGDLLRFLGYSVTEAWGAVSDAGAQVNLKAKTSVIMRRVFFITNQLDKKYKIVEKLQKALSVFISMVTKLFFRMKADMDT